MKSKLFKWISKKSLANDPILWVFTEEMIQEKAEAEIGRRLTQDELLNFVDLWHEDLEIDSIRQELISELISKAVSGPDTWV